MTLTYPKAARLSVGYDQHEDRLFLIYHLQDGGFRKAFLSRRVHGSLPARMSEVLAASHPLAGRTAHRDEMLQMEHVAALSVGKGQADPTHQTTPRPQSQQLPTEFPGAFHITSIGLEMQQDALVIGFSGPWLGDHNPAPVPIAALGLGRAEAHQVLHLFRDKAGSAGLNLDEGAQWLKPLEYGKALGAH